jgi:transcriptional regulator with XRE-family HTH domain
MARIKKLNFGQIIRERRRQLDLTQEELAHRIKTSTLYVGHLESGRRHPSDKIVTRVADVLELDRRELFFLANPRARTLLSPDIESTADSAWDDYIKLSRGEILNSLEKGARDRVGMSARLMLRRYRQGRLPDPSRVSDLVALSNLLRKNDPILAE